MNLDKIETILGDFRGWLENLSAAPAAAPPADVFQMQTLVGQFTALRHEVNMQTKAARSAVEQTNAALQLLQTPDEPEEESEADNHEELRPFVKMLLDVHDALSVAFRQMEKAKLSAGDFAKEIGPAPHPTSPRKGFFAKLFASAAVVSPERLAYHDNVTAHHQKLQQQFAAVADGYAMSLRRIERHFPDLGLEPIAGVGAEFDPEMMEVVDTETAIDVLPGSVLEVIRQG